MIETGDDGYTAIAAQEAFCSFPDQAAASILAEGTSLAPGGAIHPLCAIAVAELQRYLAMQNEWKHNFGLDAGGEGAVIGKMFGVLVARTPDGTMGYLAAFSGKLANGNHHSRFVAPVFDGLANGGFVNAGMLRLTEINQQIAELEKECASFHQPSILRLKSLRKSHSVRLQRKIHEQYNFINKAGISRNMVDIFADHGYKQPPAGAGECAGPKLLQHAFRHRLEPLALAEFWWGLSPKSATWKHGEFYKPCKEKCAPILGYMLSS
ncbi:pseudouridylate synthase [Chitinophaga pollutisoli]|uniref:Pseudouridylate synthase n=1 Tax=Chitinophaga pollutisoli TaxID=3133966 RepID=A0ABZ2YLZ1_9BACT